MEMFSDNVIEFFRLGAYLAYHTMVVTILVCADEYNRWKAIFTFYDIKSAKGQIKLQLGENSEIFI